MTDIPADPAEALADHKRHCPHCHAERTRPGAPLCSERTRLTAAWREWLRETGNHSASPAPVQEDEKHGTGQ